MGEQQERVDLLRKTFRTGKTRSVAWRKQQLQAFLRMIEDSAEDIRAATYKDMHRSSIECELADIKSVTIPCKEALHAVEQWMKPMSVSASYRQMPSSASIRPEPLGVVLILGTWNVALSSTLGPVIEAIAAGNCVVIKPSEITPACADVMVKMVTKYLDPEAISIVAGGPEVAQSLLEEQFDHIFFTGSERIGRLVYEAAARKLTPVTLELGGKSPCVIDDTANLEVAVRRILWAKDTNCGQICVAPDYILVFKSVAKEFYETIKKIYAEFYPEGKPGERYGRIVNMRNTDRLMEMLEEDESIRGKVLVGGESDREDRFIAPTVFTGTLPEAKVMQEEIFGPLLPTFEINDLDEAISFITAKPKPLAAYLFSKNAKAIDQYINETTSGNTMINDVMWHYFEGALPFGGVGSSGIGCAHGYHGFKTFSHMKGILHKSGRPLFDASIRYPPMDENKEWYLKKFF